MPATLSYFIPRRKPLIGVCMYFLIFLDNKYVKMLQEAMENI